MPTVEQVTIAFQNNVSAAMKAAATDTERFVQALEKTDEVIRRSDRSFDTVSRRVTGSAAELARAAKINRDYEQSVAAVNRELAKNPAIADQAAETIRRLGVQRDQDLAKAAQQAARIEANFTSVAGATANVGGAFRQLGIQSIDVFQQIASGAPVMTTFIQQGGQMAQVMAAQGGALAAVRAGFAALVSPVGLAVTALAALGAGAAVVVARTMTIADETRSLDIAIRSVGRSAEIATGQVQRYVSALSQQGVGRSDATSIVGALARNGALSGAQIGRVTALTPDTATAVGADAAEAARSVAGVAAGSYDAIRKLDDAINFLTRDQRSQIRTMIEHGDSIGAAGVAMDALKGRVDGLRRDSLGPFGKAWEDITNAIDRAIDATARAKGGLPLAILSPGVSAAVNLLSSPPAAPTFRQAETAADAATNQERERQGKILDDLTKKLDEENKVLAAGLPARARVRAEIEAANTIRDKELSGDAAVAAQKAIVANATRAAADAAIQEAAAIGRQTSGSLLLIQALNDSRSAELIATAAIEAHDKAATQAGVSESAYTRAILNRNAAQEAVKASTAARDLDEQADAMRRIAEAQGPVARQAAEFNNRIVEATKSLRAYEDAATDPAIINQLIATRVQLEVRLKAHQAETIAVREQLALERGDAQLAELRKEVELVGAVADERERELAAFRTLARLQAEDAADVNNLTARQQRLIDQSREVASLQLVLRDQQNSLAAVTDTLGNAFDRLGQAMVDAFVSGSGSAVNFGNVLKAIAASVLSDFAKLAVINPILNSIVPSTNGNRPTLGAALGGGGNGLIGTAGNALSLGQIGDALGLTNFGGQLSSFGNYLGLTGPGGIFNGVGSGITGVLNTPVFSTGLGGIPLEGAYSAAQVAASGSTVTLGALLSGVGLGFGAGSLGGGLLQGALNKTGPAPQIGAGAGALTGAAIGSIIPGIGTVIGGLIGGLLGGGGGAFIGPRPASAFSSTGVELTSDGRLNVGKSIEQIYGSSRDAAVQGADTINKILDALGLTLTDIGALRQIGQNTPGGFIDPSKFSDFNTAFGQFRFSANDNELNTRIAGRSFGSPEELQALVVAFREANASAQTFLDQTSSSLTAILRPTAAYNDQLNAIWKQYQTAIDQAQALINTGNLTAANSAKLVQAEAELAAAREASVARVRAQIDAEQFQRNLDWQTRYLRASASLSGNPADALSAALYEFDNAANKQRLDYHYWLTGLYGETIRDTQAYADQMTLLERTLQQERLAIQKQYGDQSVDLERNRATALQNATSVIASISQYAAGLGTSGASPLSPLDQYNLASRQFDAVSGAAAAGNVSSLQQLTGYADRLLSASRTVNGSGVGYVNDFTRVTSSLGNVASLSTETVTASFLASLNQNTNAVFITKVDELKAEIASLRTALSQVAARPANVAA